MKETADVSERGAEVFVSQRLMHCQGVSQCCVFTCK